MQTSMPDDVSDQTLGPLKKIQDILSAMASESLSYCHWKSNYHIQYALAGQEDLDILVDPQDFPRFMTILLNEDFKLAESITSAQQPGVFHFLGNDKSSGTLVNVHAYTRILTGDHFLKTYALPLEKILLGECSEFNGIRLPDKSSELIVFVLRNMLKHTTLMDLILNRHGNTATQEELEWLEPDVSMEPALEKLKDNFPDLAATDFRQAVTLLSSSNNNLKARLLLARRFQKVLNKYRRYGTLYSAFGTGWAVTRMYYNRKILGVKHMSLLGGGAVIALVGPQATGKTTLATELQRWLGCELGVRRIHAGKPPATWYTKLPNLLIPLTRTLFPRYKTETVESQVDSSKETTNRFPWVFVIRKVLVALDRRALLRMCYRWARNGKIVLSDRYPSDNPGAVDGMSFSGEQVANEKSAIKRYLMSWERRIYQDICPPDLVLALQAPTDVAVVRNVTRNKVDAGDEGYVRRRHSMRRKPVFEHCPVVQISTDRSIEETVRDAKNHVWRHL
ncbi:MAG: hypothetical protein PVG22_10770 [Chromatiales bacterium]|jgi:thymidylate kinase